MKKKKDRLQTERLTLKPFDECDRSQMVALLCNEEIKKTYMIPDFTDKRKVANILTGFRILGSILLLFFPVFSESFIL